MTDIEHKHQCIEIDSSDGEPCSSREYCVCTCGATRTDASRSWEMPYTDKTMCPTGREVLVRNKRASHVDDGTSCSLMTVGFGGPHTKQEYDKQETDKIDHEVLYNYGAVQGTSDTGVDFNGTVSWTELEDLGRLARDRNDL